MPPDIILYVLLYRMVLLLYYAIRISPWPVWDDANRHMYILCFLCSYINRHHTVHLAFGGMLHCTLKTLNLSHFTLKTAIVYMSIYSLHPHKKEKIDTSLLSFSLLSFFTNLSNASFIKCSCHGVTTLPVYHIKAVFETTEVLWIKFWHLQHISFVCSELCTLAQYYNSSHNYPQHTRIIPAYF